jgi:hypothetical protein
LFDAFYSPPEPVVWIKRHVEVAKNGHFQLGRNVYSFELALAPTTSRQLVETLKGFCIRTNYVVSVSVNRGFSSRTVSTECELYVQVPNDSLSIGRSLPQPQLQQFKINDILSGEVQSTVQLGNPIMGHVMILENSTKSQYTSVELELVRIEDVHWGEESIREVCEIHTMQIIDGMLSNGTLVPFFFVVPRLAASPSYSCEEFEVSYFLNVLVILKSSEGEVLSRNLPITFLR